VANVQVYDPAHDQWSAGTPVPNTPQYKALGASGVIIGDTIYYHGGASAGGNFPAQDRVRIGHIDPLMPTAISWLPAVAGTLGARYRSGAITVDGAPVWLGGSAVTYNYDALAYNGSGVVDPATEILRWNNGLFSSSGNTPARVMDLRGVGEIGDGSFVIAGGMGEQQAVLDSVWLLHYESTGIGENTALAMAVYPLPAQDHVSVQLPSELRGGQFALYNAIGSLMHTGIAKAELLQFDVRTLPAGVYVLRVQYRSAVAAARILVVGDR